MDPLALLRLQIEWGADESLSDEPLDRLAVVAPAVPATTSGLAPSSPSVRPVAPPGGGSPRAIASGGALPVAPTAERASALAAQAQDLAALREVIAGFEGFGLRDTASNLVFAEGDPAARLLLIGEPPGADEDRAGRPFAGADGALLDRMLASIGLQRSAMLLAPLIPWRPPGGRPPHATELAVCLPFLIRLIELAGPAHVVTFGTLTARTLAPGRKRGNAWGELTASSGAVQVLPLPGLGAIRKDPARRREAWAGLRRLRRALDGQAGA